MIPLIQEFKSSNVLVEILCGDSLAVHLTLSRSPVIWEGNNYLPEPGVTIQLPEQTGGIDEESCSVRLPRSNAQHPGVLALVELLASPRAAPPTTVRVISIVQSSQEDSLVEYLYEGVMDRRTRNPRGLDSSVELSIVPEWKLGLDNVTLGRRCDGSCDLAFGSLPCGVDLTKPFLIGDHGFPGRIRRLQVTCTLSSDLTGRQVTLTPVSPAVLTDLTIRDRDWWVRGRLEKDGLWITISDWFYNDAIPAGTNIFTLNRIPPSSWDGSVVTLVPGCVKTPAACSARANSERYGGLGYGIPSYNPTIEVGGD